MSRYENGKNRALLYALECAIQDREALLDAMGWPLGHDEDREARLAMLPGESRKVILRTESYIRDFRALQLSFGEKSPAQQISQKEPGAE